MTSDVDIQGDLRSRVARRIPCMADSPANIGIATIDESTNTAHKRSSNSTAAAAKRQNAGYRRPRTTEQRMDLIADDRKVRDNTSQSGTMGGGVDI